MSDLKPIAEEIAQDLADRVDCDVAVNDVLNRLSNLVTEYEIPLEEAKRSVIHHYLDDEDAGLQDFYQADTEVGSIKSDGEWVTIYGKVVDLWEPRSDSVSQVGLFGDESGTVKFVSWATSELPELEEGEIYRLRDVVTEEYDGSYSVKLNSETTITHHSDDELEVKSGSDPTVFEGALVDILSGSGLIKRCPQADCTRVLRDGRCSEHGSGNGTCDLRIKAVLDDGQTVQKVIFDQEATEEVGGMTLDEAKELAMDRLDMTVVAQQLQEKLIGRFFHVKGAKMEEYLLVDDFEQQGGPTQELHEDVLAEGRSAA